MVDATKAPLLQTEPDTVTAAPLLPTESVTTAAFHPSNHSTPLRRFPSEVADYLSPLQKRQTEISNDSTFFEELDMSVVEADKVCCNAPVPEKKETVTAAPLLPTEQDVTKKKQAPAPVVDPKPNCWYLFEFEGRTKKKIVYVGEVKTAIGIEITVQFYRIAAPLMDKLTFKKDRGGVEIVYADQVIAKVNPPEFLNKGLIKFEASTFSAVNSKNIA